MASVAGAEYERLTPSAAERFLSWVATTDHKRIGILYLVTTAFFFGAGGIEALVMRIQLAQPNAKVLTPTSYNALFTMHGTTMIFLSITPAVIGLANYFVPLMIGARDMAFPRLNALSYWFLLFGGLLLYFSFLAGSPPDTGWFSYSPLTEAPYAMSKGVDYWIIGVTTVSLGSIVGAINILVTIITQRAPGMTPFRMPLFVWMSGFNTLLILGAIPSLTASQLMLLFDRHLGTKFFNVAAGGDPLLWQHLFWWFGHPEVYIMILPLFGVLSEVFSTFARQRIFGYLVLIAAGFAVAFFSFLVWVHHMFATGLGYWPDALTGIASLCISVPTGVKIFNWLATIWRGKIRFTSAMLFALGFIVTFTIGGITGVEVGLVPIDWQVTDSYFIVAHFHYVLVGGSYLALIAGVYYWFPKISGKMLDETLGKWHFWLTMIGVNLTFFPMHIVGLMGMRRRVWTYPDLPGWGPINLIESIGSGIIAISILVFLWNLFVSLRHGQAAGDNPWDAPTLEWATSSPPPVYNFARIPPVPIRSPQPLWDAEEERQRQESAPVPAVRGGSLPTVRNLETAVSRIAPPVHAVYAFISTEIVFFGSLIVVFIEYRARSSSGPRPDAVDVPRTFLFSLALWASSGTIVLAGRALRRDNQRGFRLWLLATIALGATFLYGQITEYQAMYREHVKLSDNLFTSAFFTLTGFHGLHVTAGLIALIILAGFGFAGTFSSRHRTAVEAVSVYWHFVDAVWVIIFSLVYLWTVL